MFEIEASLQLGSQFETSSMSSIFRARNHSPYFGGGASACRMREKRESRSNQNGAPN
jgi:hypothetical protein